MAQREAVVKEKERQLQVSHECITLLMQNTCTQFLGEEVEAQRKENFAQMKVRVFFLKIISS